MKEPRFFNSGYSECIHHKSCKSRGNKPCFKKYNKYKETKCFKTIRPPYVCNGCVKKEFCKLRRFFYDYSLAQNDYNDLLVESRNSIYLTKSKHPEILNFSKSTFYRYTDAGIFTSEILI